MSYNILELVRRALGGNLKANILWCTVTKSEIAWNFMALQTDICKVCAQVR